MRCVWVLIPVALIAVATLVAFRLLGGGMRGDLRRRQRGGEDPESLSWRSRHSRGYRDGG
jgi:hypothetical protein